MAKSQQWREVQSVRRPQSLWDKTKQLQLSQTQSGATFAQCAPQAIFLMMRIIKSEFVFFLSDFFRNISTFNPKVVEDRQENIGDWLNFYYDGDKLGKADYFK